jgi:hypothetical protein
MPMKKRPIREAILRSDVQEILQVKTPDVERFGVYPICKFNGRALFLAADALMARAARDTKDGE